MNTTNRNLLNLQANSVGSINKKYIRNPLSYSLFSFDPLIVCMLTFKYDYWINRHSPSDRTFVPKVYLRSFCQIAGVIYKDLCWTSNVEHIDSNHFHIHLVLFNDGLNPYRSEGYVNILESLWSIVMNLDDFNELRGLEKVFPRPDPDTRARLRKNYTEALRSHFLGIPSSFQYRMNFFTGDIVKNKTPYRFRSLTGMGKCIIKTYDKIVFGRSGLFYNQKDQDQLSYCDFSPALIKKARLSSRFNMVKE
jgi:hypothetical protein